MAKYDTLRDFLGSLPKSQKQVILTFARIERILGEPLPESATTYLEWWTGGHVKRGRIDANWQDQVQQKAWEEVGWGVDDVFLDQRNVTFRRRPS